MENKSLFSTEIDSSSFADLKKHLKSLNSMECSLFLGAASKDKEYNGYSNAQSIYKKMLDSGKYMIDRKEDADGLLSDMQVIFGKDLYDKIYTVLESQRQARVEEIRATAPAILYHASAQKLNKLEPRLNTCQFGIYRDKMCFASESLEKIQMHSFRDARRSDGHKATSIITSAIETPFGKRKIGLSSHFHREGYLYELPSKNFIPVVRLDGHFNHEWISFSEVTPIAVRKRHISEIEKKGDMLCFEFSTIQAEESFLKGSREWKKKFDAEGYPAIKELIKNGIIARVDTRTQGVKEKISTLDSGR